MGGFRIVAKPISSLNDFGPLPRAYEATTARNQNSDGKRGSGGGSVRGVDCDAHEANRRLR